MAREVTLFKSKERKSRTDICAFLHELADKIETGNITLSRGKESLPLNLPQRLLLEVEVEEETKKRKGKQHSLEIELKWYENADEHGILTLK